MSIHRELATDPSLILATVFADILARSVITGFLDFFNKSFASWLKTPADATPALLNSIYKPGRGVAQFYLTSATYDQVKAHYESELTRNGWTLFGERKLEIFQRFPGAMHALFCKDGYPANLFYAGPEAPPLGYNYSLAINWGLSSGFVWGVEDCK